MKGGVHYGHSGFPAGTLRQPSEAGAPCPRRVWERGTLLESFASQAMRTPKAMALLLQVLRLE
jgi:hypothetical protein